MLFIQYYLLDELTLLLLRNLFVSLTILFQSLYSRQPQLITLNTNSAISTVNNLLSP